MKEQGKDVGGRERCGSKGELWKEGKVERGRERCGRDGELSEWDVLSRYSL